MAEEFKEIAHSGGKVTFTFKTGADGTHAYQVSYTSSRPVPMVLIGIYALPEGIPLGTIHMGGIGTPWNPPPLPVCLPVLITSDSQGQFGHRCPGCNGYWRSGPWPNVCPYCAVRAEGYQFLSEAQLRYVRHYCKELTDGLNSIENGEVLIDMDAVADAAGKEGPKPAFYVAEQSQQQKYKCAACDEFNDILGRFGYCSACGTRNDLQEFKSKTVTAIRASLNSGGPPEDSLKDIVGAFDTLAGQYGKQLAALVPMTERRAKRLNKQRFHNLTEVRDTFLGWFDIDVFKGISADEQGFARRMFLRRHLYEHNGGEVDQQYLDASGDTSVRLKQHIRETGENVHSLIGFVERFALNLHNGFHELLPPVEAPIKAFEQKKTRMAEYGRGRRS